MSVEPSYNDAWNRLQLVPIFDRNGIVVEIIPALLLNHLHQEPPEYEEDWDRILDESLRATSSPPKEVSEKRQRRCLIRKKEDGPDYQRWKTVKDQDKCHGTCSICAETFKPDDWVMRGATGQYYHRKEMLQWIRQPNNLKVTDPNTGLELETYVPEKKTRKRHRNENNQEANLYKRRFHI